MRTESLELENPRVHRWTRDEYYKMAEVGLFDGKRVELIAGEVLEMSPMNDWHAAGVTKGTRTFFRVFGESVTIRPQLPLPIGDDSEPEPDISIVENSPDDYRSGHPTMALLVLEISDTTLPYDRTVKASLYASAGIPEYWISNIPNYQLEVRRDPVPDATQRHGFRYADVRILKPEDSVSPLFAPQVSIRAGDLLP